MINAMDIPRIGFAGLGWIGLTRLRAIASSGNAQVVAICDSSPSACAQARLAIAAHAPEVRTVSRFEQLLEERLDGIVIATPSGLHAQQTIDALAEGAAVFCQKPLARDAAEAARVIDVASVCNRLLRVDFCYRTVAGVPQMLELARSGTLGEIFAADLIFHNAYGPDKPWFYDIRQSGGGCVMDLGIHMLDLAMLFLGRPRLDQVHSQLHAGGKPVIQPGRELEDHAFAEIPFESGATARLACSWRLAAGKDAVIEASFYGTKGAAVLRNVNGSFYEFVVQHCIGTTHRTLASGDTSWGGRAANEWVAALRLGTRFAEDAWHLYELSALIDSIYRRARGSHSCES